MSFANPSSIIKYLVLREGTKVADFGAGSGAYVKEAVQVVGATGRVYAIEIQKELGERLKKELIGAGVKNAEVIWGDIERSGGTKLADQTLDAGILSNTLFLLPDKTTALREIARVTKPGGKVLLVDWTDSFGNLGPVPDMIVSPKDAQTLFEKNGFSLLEMLPESGEHHYGMIFVRAESR